MPPSSGQDLHLEPRHIGDRLVLEGRETEESGRPFFILPGAAPKALVENALRAAVEELTYGDHNDEADWRPAYEVYIMEKGIPLLGVAPAAFVAALQFLDRSLMSFVREVYQCRECVACTAFVRRFFPYERAGVPAHFDITSFATIVLPLSPPGNYTGGFYVQPEAHVDSRRFVPLEMGDVALYDFSLNHGVEVLDGGRYVLALWVSDTKAACDSSQTPWHPQRAQEGDAVAQHILGMMYGQGNGAPKDDVKALEWTLLAAQGGLVNAQSSAGTMYFEGLGTPVDKARAFYWYERAAMAGDASAQMIIARMHLEGIGTQQNESLANYWYQLGSSQRGATFLGPPSWS